MSGHPRAAQVVLPCPDLDASLRFFTGELGFRIELVMPADAPKIAVVSGHGLTLRLESSAAARTANPLRLRLLCDRAEGAPREMTAPDGTRVEFVAAEPALALPEAKQEFVLVRRGAGEDWARGRAGMEYRDLIPGRLGGRFVASQIRIADGGAVPDYVHFHKIRFQMIYCMKGWARLVYEDQGEPFRLERGDCVLQPPEIRHRVLESSTGLEVIEIGSPAVHETFADHAMLLPTPAIRPERRFAGQRFLRHGAARASWEPWRLAGFEARDSAIADATAGLAGARVVRPVSGRAAEPVSIAHGGEFLFFFVLQGALGLASRSLGRHRLEAGDCCVIPAGARHALSAEPGLEMLEVTLPAELPRAD